jgi:hypothetical protein
MQATQARRHAAQHETATALEHVKTVAEDATDLVLLDLCRRRLDELLDGGPPVDSAGLSTREIAFLAFTDQFVFSVASVGEQDVAALLVHAEPLDVYQYTCALYALELSLRIEIATRAVLPDQEATA